MTEKGIIRIIAIVHFFSGLLIFQYGSLLYTVKLAAISRLVPEYHIVGAILIVSSLMAFFSFNISRKWLSILLCMPQQFLVTLSFMTALLAIGESQYADGVFRPWQFIASDQMYVICAFFGNLYGIFGEFAPELMKKTWLQK